jgi:hypothetical protein
METIQDIREGHFHIQYIVRISVLLERDIILTPYNDKESMVLKLLS